MPDNKRNKPQGSYYDGRTHFSYNNDLTYRPHQFRAHETIQGMVKRAEQSITENQFKS